MTHNATAHLRSPTRQTGAALIIGLVLLISLTIVGVSVLSTTTLEQRMVGNMADAKKADTAAELITDQVLGRAATILGLEGMGDVCNSIGATTCMTRQDNNWWDTATVTFWNNNAVNAPNFFFTIAGVGNQPQVILELERRATYTQVRGVHRQTPGIDYIRMTSRGTGAAVAGNTEIIIQQTFTKQ